MSFEFHNVKMSALLNGRKGNTMNFYETQMGQHFYSRTLPQIATALGKIADSLSTPVPCIRITQEVPDDFLTNLYWGNYDPIGEADSEESVQCSAEIKAAQAKIKAQVTPELWAQIDNIFSLLARRSNVDRSEAYAAGFRSAVTMLAAGLSKSCGKEAA